MAVKMTWMWNTVWNLRKIQVVCVCCLSLLLLSQENTFNRLLGSLFKQRERVFKESLSVCLSFCPTRPLLTSKLLFLSLCLSFSALRTLISTRNLTVTLGWEVTTETSGFLLLRSVFVFLLCYCVYCLLLFNKGSCYCAAKSLVMSVLLDLSWNAFDLISIFCTTIDASNSRCHIGCVV